MRTPPRDLTAADLHAVLAHRWELTDLTSAYAPVGFGGHHWLAASGDGPTWFVTAQRDRIGLTTALEVAADLRDEAGLSFVVAPVRNEADEFVAPCGNGYLVYVAPFLPDARDWPAAEESTPVHRQAVVELTAALHGALISTEPWEDDFSIEARDALDSALADLDTPWPDGGLYTEGVRGRLRPAAPRVRAALAGYDALVGKVRARDAPFVVTHGEIKPGNLLSTPAGPALVDWDTVLLAPPERDLWRLTDPDIAAYAARTGHVVDPDARALYRARWDLTDIALYVADLRTACERTADTDLAWQELRRRLT